MLFLVRRKLSTSCTLSLSLFLSFERFANLSGCLEYVDTYGSRRGTGREKNEISFVSNRVPPFLCPCNYHFARCHYRAGRPVSYLGLPNDEGVVRARGVQVLSRIARGGQEVGLKACHCVSNSTPCKRGSASEVVTHDPLYVIPLNA